MQLCVAYICFPRYKLLYIGSEKMRIVGGKFRSRVIKAPNGMNTRPTSDKVKESMFNIINQKIFNAKCLDLFAGSGNLGLEAISRGANYVYFVDHNKNSINIIKENIKTLNVESQCKVFPLDYLVALKNINDCFDIIFLDPPYRYDILNNILKIVEEKNMINEFSIIIYESDKEHQLNDGNFINYTLKKYIYGDTVLNFLTKK